MLGKNERRKVMRSQIDTFKERVRLCHNSYSTNISESMIGQMRTQDRTRVDSIYKLEKYVRDLTPHEKHHKHSVYATWYLSNFEYLKELKANFDERIYIPLSDLYQSPEREEHHREATDLSESRASSAASVLKFKHDLPDVRDLYDFTEVENIASRLGYIRQRWQLLLDDENEISNTLFSYNSQIEVSPTCPKEIINLLRLVPDILVKCSNAASLAIQWLDCASSKSLDLQTKSDKLERLKSVLTDKLTGLSEKIKSEEKELESESSDLELLADREERTSDIQSQTHQIDQLIRKLKLEIHQLTEQTELLKHQQDSNDQRMDVTKTIRENELKVFKLHQEIQINEYQKELLDEDLSIEMEVKPCMIRHTDQIQEKCESLEQMIDCKRIEKQRVESALIPVMADSQKARAEISKTNSATSTSQHTIVPGIVIK